MRETLEPGPRQVVPDQKQLPAEMSDAARLPEVLQEQEDGGLLLHGGGAGHLPLEGGGEPRHLAAGRDVGAENAEIKGLNAADTARELPQEQHFRKGLFHWPEAQVSIVCTQILTQMLGITAQTRTDTRLVRNPSRTLCRPCSTVPRANT